MIFLQDGRLEGLLLFLLLLASSLSLFPPPLVRRRRRPPCSPSPPSPPPALAFVCYPLVGIPPKIVSVNRAHHIVFCINDLKHWPLTPLSFCYNVRIFFRYNLFRLSLELPLTADRFLLGQLYFLSHGRPRLSSLPRSLSPWIVVVKCIYEYGPYGLPVSIPDIPRFSDPLPSTKAILAAKTQSDFLSSDIYDCRQPRTRCGRTDCSSIQDAATVPPPASATTATGPID